MAQLLAFKAQEIGLLSSRKLIPQGSKLSDVFGVLEKACDATRHGQLVILIDEMEVLQDFTDRQQVLRILRSVVLECSCIHFVLAGAESWYYDYQDNNKEKSSPIHNGVDKKVLRAPASGPIGQYLIMKPLADYLSPTYDIKEITSKVLEWTGSKPYYVQAICAATVRTCIRSMGICLIVGKPTFKRRFYNQCGSTIRDSYKGANIDELSQRILALLAIALI